MGKNNLSGAWGEALAAKYLKKKHYKLVATNFRSRFGEIDLIARKGNFLCFVEVKLRKDAVFAQAKADYLLNVKKQSLSAIKLKLSCLGIDKDIIDSVLLSFELDNQIDEISSLLQSKYRSKLSSPEKVVASLLRKGFKYGEIKQAFNNLNINLQEY